MFSIISSYFTDTPCCCNKQSNVALSFETVSAQDVGPPVFPVGSDDSASEGSDSQDARHAVMSFVSEASAGCPCIYLKESTGERSPATFTIDRKATKLSVKIGGSKSQEKEFTCALASIVDVYNADSDSPVVPFPAQVLASLTLAERCCLVMVVFSVDGPVKKTDKICLLTASQRFRNSCWQCLPVLAIYARKLDEKAKSTGESDGWV